MRVCEFSCTLPYCFCLYRILCPQIALKCNCTDRGINEWLYQRGTHGLFMAGLNQSERSKWKTQKKKLSSQRYRKVAISLSSKASLIETATRRLIATSITPRLLVQTCGFQLLFFTNTGTRCPCPACCRRLIMAKYVYKCILIIQKSHVDD